MKLAMLMFGILGVLYMVYHGLILLIGALKKLPEMPVVTPTKRFSVLIPARNEENVLPNLIASLLAQHYPRELYDVFVLPNNCTDDTEGAALRSGANVIPIREKVQSKGEVLRIAFQELEPKGYDGYLIFDADNLVDPGFLQAANDAMCAGYQVGQGYRDSKNPGDNWVAGCTSVFFWFMNRLFNRSRAALGMSAHLNGTGILLGARMIREHGYNVHSLTEDQEYTAICALAGEKIAWMPRAVTYDEQPTRLRDSMIQRRRWAAGTRQCFACFAGRLYRGFFTYSACRDVALHFTGVPMQLLSFVPGILTVVTLIKGIVREPASGVKNAVILLTISLVVCFLSGALMVLAVCLLERRPLKPRFREMCAMGLYIITWLIANLAGFCLKAPGWKAIPHVSTIGIKDLNGDEHAV